MTAIRLAAQSRFQSQQPNIFSAEVKSWEFKVGLAIYTSAPGQAKTHLTSLNQNTFQRKNRQVIARIKATARPKIKKSKKNTQKAGPCFLVLTPSFPYNFMKATGKQRRSRTYAP